MWTMARDPDTARSAVRRRRRGTLTHSTRLREAERDRYKKTTDTINQLADKEISVIGNVVLLMAEMALSLASIADSLDSVESATSPGDERGTGRWVEVDDYAICGECGAVHHGADRNYCPNCGRKMKTGDPGVKKEPEGGTQEWRVIDKEAPVPVSWIEKEIEDLRSQNNEFAGDGGKQYIWNA